MSESKSSRPDDSLSLSALKEIDAICDRFEAAWEAKQPSRLEDYLVDDWPPERNRALLTALLAIEIDRRRAKGQQPLIADYCRRFPSYAAEVRQAFVASEKREPATREDHSSHPISNTSRQIGPYKLLQQIGEGGMGTVWMAQQDQPVHRRVALKLIKSGGADKQVIARFEADLSFGSPAAPVFRVEEGSTVSSDGSWIMGVGPGNAGSTIAFRYPRVPVRHL